MFQELINWTLFIAVLYLAVGAILGIIAGGYVTLQCIQVIRFLDRSKTVRIKEGPVFTPESDRGRIIDWFTMIRGFGISVKFFLFWPIMIHILIKDTKHLKMIEEVID